MHIFYDPADGRITHTLEGNPDPMPPGDRITVPDGTDVEPLESYRVQNGELVREDIEPLRIQTTLQINLTADLVRQKYITAITGQQMIYQEKEAEAQRFLAEPTEPTDLSEYPWIEAEIGATGETANQVAQVFLNLAAQWRQLGPVLEGLRIKAKTDVAAAVTPTEVRQVLTDYEAAMAQF